MKNKKNNMRNKNDEKIDREGDKSIIGIKKLSAIMEGVWMAGIRRRRYGCYLR